MKADESTTESTWFTTDPWTEPTTVESTTWVSYNTMIHVGFHDLFEEGEYLTVKGK
jgi:hypothetical protein